MEEACVRLEHYILNTAGILFNELFVFCVIHGELTDADWGDIFFLYRNIFGPKGYDAVDRSKVDSALFILEM